MDPTTRIIPTRTTLVGYKEPVIVRDVAENEETIEPVAIDEKTDHEIKRMMALRLSPGCPDPANVVQFGLEDVLNTVVPPVEWIDDGKMWRQTVANDEVTREETKKLARKLDAKLSERQALVKGVCPIRRQLYSQFFDALIRQTTNLSPETGLLLMRVRDELHMTLDAYASIYETCKVYESKCINSPKTEVSQEDQPPSELESKVIEIKTESKSLEQQIRKLEDGIQLKELKFQEILDAEESLYQKELEHLTKVKAQLERQLELFKGPNPHTEVVKESILDQILNQGDKNRDPI